MERRDFLKLTAGLAVGAAALASGAAKAAPLPPRMPDAGLAPDKQGPQPAVTSQDDVDQLKPEQVRWGWRRRRWRRRHWGWRRRHWGWRRRYWRRRWW